MTLALIVRDPDVCELIQRTMIAAIDAYQQDNPGVRYQEAAMVVSTEMIVQGFVTLRCMKGIGGSPEEAVSEAMKVIREHFGYKADQN